jgi:hypothetical protein
MPSVAHIEVAVTPVMPSAALPRPIRRRDIPADLLDEHGRPGTLALCLKLIQCRIEHEVTARDCEVTGPAAVREMPVPGGCAVAWPAEPLLKLLGDISDNNVSGSSGGPDQAE